MKAALILLLVVGAIHAAGQACSPELPCRVIEKWSMAGGRHDLTRSRLSPATSMARAARMCAVCHGIQDKVADSSQRQYLWTASGAGRVSVFMAPSLDLESPPQPSQTAQCLSCHDGTVAISAGSNPSPTVETTIELVPAEGAVVKVTVKVKDSDEVIGNSRKCVHPVSMIFDKQVAERHGLRVPSAKASVDGLGIVPLYGSDSRLECATCHDPHRDSEAMQRQFPTGTKQDGGTGNFCLYCHL